MSLEITLTGQLAAEAGGNRADATHLPGARRGPAGRGPGHFRAALAALAAHERLGARPWRALTIQAYAGMLRGRDGHGDRARAANLDATAHAGADRLGMALPGWGHPGPRAPLLTGQTTEVPRCSWPASAA